MKTLDNATVALTIIAESPEPVSVAEIGKRLGLPRSSASRLMASLRDGRFVEQDPNTRRYGPGLLAWQLGARYRPVGYDADLLAQCLTSLSQVTGFTSWMAVLDRTNVVLLRQHLGRTPAQFSVRLGQTLPSHATAVGKALLSRLPDNVIEMMFEETLSQGTPQTFGNRAELLEDIRTARERGFALSRQEAFPGVVAVGGAVFGTTANFPIGLSLSFPAQLGEIGNISGLLTSELRRVGCEIGDPFWTGSH
ncbi:MAG: IclR family transcriptional regulator [Roseovarius sp.]